MEKVFKDDQKCPAGKSFIVDSTACRKCEQNYGPCGYLFIWCAGDIPEAPVKKVNTAPDVKRRPGRPKGAKNKKRKK